MKGFFSSIKKVSNAPVEKKEVVHSCADCPLKDQPCSKGEVEVTGEGEKKILVLVGTQHIKPKHFERLEAELERVGINLYNDCYTVSVIQSFDPKHEVAVKVNGKTQKKEITDSALYLACCRQKVHAFIKEYNPVAILALGDRAMTSLVKHRSDFRGSFGTIDTWEGYCIPDQHFGSWIIPTWPIPRLVEAEESREGNGKVYTRHFRFALKQLEFAVKKGHPPIRNDESNIEIIMDDDKAIERIEECIRWCHKTDDHVVSFDYETTGLKPFLPKHKCVCVSLCWRPDLSVAFELNRKTWNAFEKFLKDKKCKKTAHNIQFEELWTRVKAPSKIRVAGWKQDTQLDAHILDNRTGNAGLKYQTYVNFGVAGYDGAVDKYLEAEQPNDLNRILDLPMQTILKYCALDSLYGHWLARVQDKKFEDLAKHNPLVYEARKLFRDGAIALCGMTEAGMRIDQKVLKSNKLEVQKRIAELHELIMEDPDVKKWKKRMGPEFNLNSNDQLADTLFKYMKLEPTQFTDKGKPATDAKTLSEYPVPFLEHKAEIKKLEKLMGTYVDGVGREAPDGFLHPFYPLSGPRTFRSSSNSPNLQNIPKRWPYAKQMIRRCMFPSKPGCFFEADYSSLEVGIGACYHKDPNMLKYLQGHGDMHRDAAIDAFLLHENPDLMTKPLRQGGKNGFVFPEFYGDYYGNCAVELWKNYVLKEKLSDGTSVKTWLARKGIKTFEDFKEHMKEVEHILWNERFKDFGQWRNDMYQEYVRTGQYWNKTGFPYHGIMNKKDSSNYAVQGSAFHVNLYAMTELDKEIVRNKYNSYMCGEIHDAIIGVITPEELNDFIPLLQTVMVDRCKERFPWVISPLAVEIEVAPMNKSWTELEVISQRPTPCKCGAEWGYKKKPDSQGRIRWECPICEHFSYEE